MNELAINYNPQIIDSRVLFKIEPKEHLSSKSLLRYPGGKTRGVEIITKYFPDNLTELCSPFFGGGSIELTFAAKGVKVYGYDVFRPLVEFWQCVSKYPNELANVVQEYYPLSREKFYELQRTQTKFKTKLERAAVYYVLNRASFSGSTLSGGMSPEHKRFTQTSIDRLRVFNNQNFSVSKLDFTTSIPLNKNRFLYLDPPYLIENPSLYGKNGNAHKGFNHKALFKLLNKRGNWILSYNDCEQIRKLYSKYPIISLNWKYGMSTDKDSKEVLIFSLNTHNGITNHSRESHKNV